MCVRERKRKRERERDSMVECGGVRWSKVGGSGSECTEGHLVFRQRGWVASECITPSSTCLFKGGENERDRKRSVSVSVQLCIPVSCFTYSIFHNCGISCELVFWRCTGYDGVLALCVFVLHSLTHSLLHVYLLWMLLCYWWRWQHLPNTSGVGKEGRGAASWSQRLLHLSKQLTPIAVSELNEFISFSTTQLDT